MKAWLAAALAVAGVLLKFPPERYAFYPRCPIYEAFGLLCPGCGATRAASALLHGHLRDAWHWNPLFVTVLFVGVLCVPIRRRGNTRPRAAIWAVCAGLAVTVLFGVGRNLV